MDGERDKKPALFFETFVVPLCLGLILGQNDEQRLEAM
jgi:hypothetical protein